MSLSSVAGILDGYGGWHTVVAPRKSLRHPHPKISESMARLVLGRPLASGSNGVPK